jgi:hypothetical protein
MQSQLRVHTRASCLASRLCLLTHYIVNPTGTGGERLVSIVCENHDIPITDFRNQAIAPIRDIVKAILVSSPPRCAILLDTRNNELMQKVRARIASTSCDLRYRRNIFCPTDREGSADVDTSTRLGYRQAICTAVPYSRAHSRNQAVYTNQ